MTYLSLGSDTEGVESLPTEGSAALETPPVDDLSTDVVDDVVTPDIIAADTPTIESDSEHRDPDEFFAINANQFQPQADDFLSRPLLFGLTIVPLAAIGVGLSLLLRRRR